MTDKNKELHKHELELEKGVERTKEKRVFTPAVDIIEKKDNILLIADMPGVDEKSVDITLEKNLLTIHGYVEPRYQKDHRLAVSEYREGDYERVFTISDEIDREHIEATVKDGVLRLTLPKAAKAKAVRIPVKGNA